VNTVAWLATRNKPFGRPPSWVGSPSGSCTGSSATSRCGCSSRCFADRRGA